MERSNIFNHQDNVSGTFKASFVPFSPKQEGASHTSMVQEPRVPPREAEAGAPLPRVDPLWPSAEDQASLDPTGLSHTEPHSRATCTVVWTSTFKYAVQATSPNPDPHRPDPSSRSLCPSPCSLLLPLFLSCFRDSTWIRTVSSGACEKAK